MKISQTASKIIETQKTSKPKADTCRHERTAVVLVDTHKLKVCQICGRVLQSFSGFYA